MEAFSPATWYQRADGEWVAVIAPATEFDPESLIGHRVTLGGAPFLVTGVELVLDPEPLGPAFGLRVEVLG